MSDKIKAKIFIDGSNIFYTQKKLGWSLDWSKVKQLVESEKEILEWKYYVGLKPDDDRMPKFLRYLNAIGFNTVTKPLKKIKLADDEHRPQGISTGFIYKANFDVEITADILLDKSRFDEIILFSGDSDFEYLAKKLKDSGKKVVVYSSKRTISWELKLVASQVIYFENLEKQIKRLDK